MPRPRKAINQINVVPYIDVMLVLLVIFMITAPLINPASALPIVAAPVLTAQDHDQDRSVAVVGGGWW